MVLYIFTTTNIIEHHVDVSLSLRTNWDGGNWYVLPIRPAPLYDEWLIPHDCHRSGGRNLSLLRGIQAQKRGSSNAGKFPRSTMFEYQHDFNRTELASQSVSRPCQLARRRRRDLAYEGPPERAFSSEEEERE